MGCEEGKKCLDESIITTIERPKNKESYNNIIPVEKTKDEILSQIRREERRELGLPEYATDKEVLHAYNLQKAISEAKKLGIEVKKGDSLEKINDEIFEKRMKDL